MLNRCCRFIVPLLCAAVLAGCSSSKRADCWQELCRYTTYFDSEKYEQETTLDEHIDTVFAEVLNREATDTEREMFHRSSADHDEENHEDPDTSSGLNLQRSAIFAYAMMQAKQTKKVDADKLPVARGNVVTTPPPTDPGKIQPGPDTDPVLLEQAPENSINELAGHLTRPFSNLNGVYPSYKTVRHFMDEDLFKKTLNVPELSIPFKILDAGIGIPFALKDAAVRFFWPKRDLLALTPKRERGKNYTCYFGYVHSHTGLSWDAKGEPEDAYKVAKKAGLDFFAVTDHSEAFVWSWENKWNRLKRAAHVANRPGNFVALHGFEWSNPLIGHMCVINSKEYISFLSHYSIESVFNWVETSGGPDIFATFNHPGRGPGNDLGELACPDPEVISKFVGLEVWSKGNNFANFFHQDFKKDGTNALNQAIQNGWYLAPIGGQDNHQMDWGKRNEFRIGVLSKTLTRVGLVKAFQARRIYATEDPNLELAFRADGFHMGSRLSNDTPRNFELWYEDGNGEEIARVQLFRNGNLIQTIVPEPGQDSIKFNDHECSKPAYYYVVVKQQPEAPDNVFEANGSPGGDEAVTAPIWFVNK